MSGKRQIEEGRAALRVMKEWGIDHIYGIPAGSFNSLMDLLATEDGMEFIQVKHEETGAMAAAMETKFTGKIAVSIGSGGPGATHLINGLYDARDDNVPTLAILGGRPTIEQNMNAFQEMNQNPFFNDVAVYNRKVAYPEQLPRVIDEAIRMAYAHKGPAVVEVPVDMGWVMMDDDAWFSSAKAHRKALPPRLNEADLDAATELLNKAERPVIFAGIGTRGARDEVRALAQKLQAPIIISGINFDSYHYEDEELLGSAYRVAHKTANEALYEADLILNVGANFPFANVTDYFSYVDYFIQIDINPASLGRRHDTDVAILGDAKEAVAALTEKIEDKGSTAWFRANLANAKNWREYLHKIETKREGELQLYQVYNAINQVADEDAIFSVDVGNTTQTSIRHLNLTPKNMWRTSALFASMGNALPGSIAAKYNFPDRQVWSLSGDGAWSMVYPDLITNVIYDLPSIHLVFSNGKYGFIEDKQEDINANVYGTRFTQADFAMAARAVGATAFTVNEISELEGVFKQAVEAEKNGEVVLIDLKITLDRPMPVEILDVDPKLTSEESANAYKARYEAEDIKPLRSFLEAEGLESKTLKRKLDADANA